MILSYNRRADHSFLLFIFRQRKTRRREEHSEGLFDYFVFDMIKKEDLSSDKKLGE